MGIITLPPASCLLTINSLSCLHQFSSRNVLLAYYLSVPAYFQGTLAISTFKAPFLNVPFGLSDNDLDEGWRGNIKRLASPIVWRN